MVSVVTEDPADRAIDYSSAFTTARRNVLFWGATTLLIAIGTSASDEPVALSSIMAGISFKPEFLTVASLFTLLFMFAGFKNAERRLIARHTGFALSDRIGHASDEIETLVSRAKILRKKVDDATRKIENLDPENIKIGQLRTIVQESTYVDKEMSKKLADLPSQLRVFGNSIGRGERWWFRLYETLPVYVLSVVALAAGAWRLVDGSGLHRFVAAMTG